jgi:hypothetical protein
MGAYRGGAVSNQCRLFHKWEPWKVISRGAGVEKLPWQEHGSDVEVARLERFCARCGDLQLRTVVSR